MTIMTIMVLTTIMEIQLSSHQLATTTMKTMMMTIVTIVRAMKLKLKMTIIMMMAKILAAFP